MSAKSLLCLALSSVALTPAVVNAAESSGSSEGQAVNSAVASLGKEPLPGFPDHWGYEGSGAAHFWSSINPHDYYKCEHGTEQSPINIGDEETDEFVIEQPAGSLTILWPNKIANDLFRIVNLGHTVQVERFPQATTNGIDPFITEATVEDEVEDFKVQQFHFHTPSEHHVGGKFSPMEVHFVHKSDLGHLMVLGIQIEVAEDDAPSTFLEQLYPYLSQIQTTKSGVIVPALNVSHALHEAEYLKDGYYSYAGSLTTPPCSEGVNWALAKNKITMSAKQWNAFKDIMGFSSRQTQRRSEAKTSGVAKAMMSGLVMFGSAIAQLLF
jgi:carbonic anhydrase